MDIFQELGKQTETILNTFSKTMSDLSQIATQSADTVSNIIVLKGKIENLKLELKKLYYEIGEDEVLNKEGKEDLIKKAQEYLDTIKAYEDKIKQAKDNLDEQRLKGKGIIENEEKEDKSDLKVDLGTDVKIAEDKVNNEEEKLEDKINQDLK